MKIEDLQELGLNKNEATVYLALVKLGQSTANAIIKSTGFHRNIVYDNLEKLSEKGLVSSIIEDKKQVFRPTKAVALAQMIEEEAKQVNEKVTKALEMSKEISNILDKNKSKFRATVHQGNKGIKEILYEILEEKEYWGIGVSNASVAVLGEDFWKVYIEKVKRNKIRERLLLNNDFNKNLPISSSKYTELRHLPVQANLITETLIYGNKVAIIVYTDPPIATLIESKDAVNSFLSYFETLWKISK